MDALRWYSRLVLTGLAATLLFMALEDNSKFTAFLLYLPTVIYLWKIKPHN